MSSQTDAHSMLPTMLGSALSGMAGRVPFHPVDTIKARMQVNVGAAQGRASYSTTLSGLRHVFHSEGLRGLYRGFGIAFWGGAPGACTYFTGYELTRNKLQEYEWGRKYPSMVHLAAGFCAEAGSCVFWVPIDVVKETLQVQPYSAEGKAPAGGQGIYYKNSLHTMRTVYRSRGFQGVYRGYGATLLSFGPFSAAYFMLYEKLKAAAISTINVETEDDLPLLAFILCGAGAGAGASFLTNPLDLVKLRLQVQRSGATAETASFQYNGTMDGITKLARNEGVRGMFRGAGARMAFHAPTTALSITLFEQCKLFFKHLLG